MSLSERCFDWLENRGKCLCNSLTWAILYVINPGHRWNEVKAKKLFHKRQSKADQESASSLEISLQAAEKFFELESQRAKSIDEKNKVLLTVAALLLATCAALAPSLKDKWLVLFPAIPVLVSIFLTLVHFGVHAVPVPDWKFAASSNSEEEARQVLIKSLVEGGERYGPFNDYRVGVFLASIRAMTMGAILVSVYFVVWIFNTPGESSAIHQIQNSSELIESLRGERGFVGQDGAKGEVGPAGEQGPPGESAEDCSVVIQLFPIVKESGATEE